jgi:hypothetical protein
MVNGRETCEKQCDQWGEEKENLTRDETNEAMGKLMIGHSTKTMLVALWESNNKSKLNHMIETVTLILGYTSKFVALDAVNT